MSNMRLFDHYINLDLEYSDDAPGGRRTVSISSLDSGIKPRIDITYKRVPGNFCYSCTIRIYNFYSAINSIWVDRIVVTAGYKNSGAKTEKLLCKVFSSYRASPGPDSETVFSCIIADAGQNLFANQGFTLTYEPSSKNTIREVIYRCCRAAGLKEILVGDAKFFDRSFLDERIPKSSFKTGYSLLSWLQKSLNDLVVQYNPSYHINCTLYNDKWNVVVQNEKGEVVGVAEDSEQNIEKSLKASGVQIIHLNMLSKADWNAGTLTVTGPWVPDVAPASIVRIPTTLFEAGTKLPNEVARSTYDYNKQTTAYFQKNRIFYVVTQSVNFSTYDSNDMELLAVPFNLSPAQNQKDETKYATIEEFAKQRLKPIHISILGDSEKSTRKDLADVTINLSSGQIQLYTIRKDDTLSMLAKNGLPLNESGTITQQFPMLRARMTNGVIEEVSGYHAWYPILLYLTYTIYKQKKALGSSDAKKFRIDINNPDGLAEANFLAYPTARLAQLHTTNKQEIAEAYKACIIYYSEVNVQPSWALGIKRALRLWEEGDIL